MSVFDEWQAGDITPAHALRALAMELGEVESTLAPLEAERAALKDRISVVVAALGGKAEVSGYGSMVITAPGVVKSYDQKALDELVVRLTQDGYGPIAYQIAQCRKETQRSGALRIVREKVK